MLETKQTHAPDDLAGRDRNCDHRLHHPALAETLYCSTWQGIRTCSLPNGYVSHETQWQGLTTGDDNQGNRWTTSRWQGIDTTTVEPLDPR